MSMDQAQMQREREAYKLIQQHEAMQQLQQLQLGQSMQSPAAQAGPSPQGMPSSMMNGDSIQSGSPSPQMTQTGGNPNPSALSEFHDQAMQTSLGLLAYMNHLVDRKDLNEEIKAGAIHTAAQAIAQLIGLQTQQTDIAPQDKIQLEQQKMQAEHQLKAVDMAHQHELDQAKLQMDSQKMQQQLALEQQKQQAEHQRTQQTHEQGLAMNADNHEFNKKLQTAKLAMAKEQADKQAEQKKTTSAK